MTNGLPTVDLGALPTRLRAGLPYLLTLAGHGFYWLRLADTL